MAERTILCVDDEESILKDLSRVFTIAGYCVLTAECAREALAILERGEAVHLVIADQRMQGMSGSELVKEIRKRYPDIVRIILSAYVDSTTLASAIKEGDIYKFLAKPWDDRELLTTVAASFGVNKHQVS